MAESYLGTLVKALATFLKRDLGLEHMKLELLSTEHCQLCEQALDMLLGMRELAGYELRVVDIANSDSLVSRYGESIPVLRYQNAELAAPFKAADVFTWLEQVSANKLETK